MDLDTKAGDIMFLDTDPFIYFFEKHLDYSQSLEIPIVMINDL